MITVPSLSFLLVSLLVCQPSDQKSLYAPTPFRLTQTSKQAPDNAHTRQQYPGKRTGATLGQQLTLPVSIPDPPWKSEHATTLQSDIQTAPAQGPLDRPDWPSRQHGHRQTDHGKHRIAQDGNQSSMTRIPNPPTPFPAREKSNGHKVDLEVLAANTNPQPHQKHKAHTYQRLKGSWYRRNDSHTIV